MSKKIILEPGTVFGRWTVLRKGPVKDHHNTYICKCECGTIKEVSTTTLVTGKSKSCGCYFRERSIESSFKRVKEKNMLDLTDKVFGELKVIKRISGYGSLAKWLCRCSCGREKTIIQASLVNGGNTTCGRCIKQYNSSKRIKESFGIADGTSLSLIKSTKIRSDNTSGVRGVSKRQDGKYTAYIGFKGKLYNLGLFSCLERAAHARKIAEDKIFKNFIQGKEKGDESQIEYVERIVKQIKKLAELQY